MWTQNCSFVRTLAASFALGAESETGVTFDYGEVGELSGAAAVFIEWARERVEPRGHKHPQPTREPHRSLSELSHRRGLEADSGHPGIRSQPNPLPVARAAPECGLYAMPCEARVQQRGPTLPGLPR